MTMTINISLPKSMYQDAKKTLTKKGYTSISEFIRDAVREKLYPGLTENGFTPEFEEEVLKAAAEPIENSVEWDGVTPFDEFVETHPPKGVKLNEYGKNPLHRRVLVNKERAPQSAAPC